jgi:hypothetical protein
MTQTIKQLNKAYIKRFKQLNKNILYASDSGLILFVEHLKYLRDTNIVGQNSAEAIVSLNTAIEEFEAYRKSQKDFHWDNFCELVKLNVKEWLIANDSI